MSICIQGVIRGSLEFEKGFKSMEKANKYIEKKLAEYKLVVDEIIEKTNNTEYKCDNYNRFIVSYM